MKITPTQRCGHPFTGARRGASVSPFQGSTYLTGPSPGRCPGLSHGAPLGLLEDGSSPQRNTRALAAATRTAIAVPTVRTGPRRGHTHGHRLNETHGPSPQPHARSPPQRNTRGIARPHARSSPQRYGMRSTYLTLLGPNGAKCDSPGQRPRFKGHKDPSPEGAE
jgi:hypothetical protein